MPSDQSTSWCCTRLPGSQEQPAPHIFPTVLADRAVDVVALTSPTLFSVVAYGSVDPLTKGCQLSIMCWDRLVILTTLTAFGHRRQQDCKLDSPKIFPAGGAFSQPKMRGERW